MKAKTIVFNLKLDGDFTLPLNNRTQLETPNY